MAARPNPTLDSVASLNADGSRRYVHPADVKGRLTSLRRLVFVVLLAILFVTPWVQINGHPAILLDIPRRQFFLFGDVFNAQDAWLLFFLVTGVGFGLLFTTTVYGRAWCGFACPQTVMVEGVFRVVERAIEGPRDARLKLEQAPWGASKIARKTVKHAVYLLLASLFAHTILGYFFPIRQLWQILSAGPSAHLEAFAWTLGLTALFYFDFGWFREQFCVIMCPYGRLQSVLTDHDSIVVGYDKKRGEPRGKLHVIGNGDCVDCKRCIAVCPTAIDIRQGLQLDCVGCTACIDACDEVMVKVGKPAGLIRLDSGRGLEGGKTRLVRPRTLLYVAAGLLGLAVSSYSLLSRTHLEVSLLRPTGAPYALDGGQIRNVFRLKLTSKRSETSGASLVAPTLPDLTLTVSRPEVTIPAMGSTEVPVIATMPADRYHGPVRVPFLIRSSDGRTREITAVFLGP